MKTPTGRPIIPKTVDNSKKYLVMLGLIHGLIESRLIPNKSILLTALADLLYVVGNTDKEDELLNIIEKYQQEPSQTTL